ncbi:MAG: KUP/HAK/KT family potassium transporter [Nitrospirae bacterium]|nr:KUP/HAK/KT family potassium transporter [Nitrospirota bacterium]NTW65490.1 KUP/HAK/KT family potassium transporter [Nitrospirota bacterium]
MTQKKSPFRGIVQSLGLVFGDIGTSPIYTLTVIILLMPKPVTDEHVIGILSLIVWTLILLVTVQYAWLAMSLGRRGEGGTIVLREILIPLLRSGRQVTLITLLSFIGISLIIGDGVITPAISILSAVEGLLLIPGFEETKQAFLIAIAGLIAIALFSVQKKGTEKVAAAFGPIMIIWFAALTLSGIGSIIHAPSVVKAVNPYYAVNFLVQHGVTGFFVLSEVILCATGGEALYADMGHLGREPIVRAWYFVFFALIINYLGQGAFVIAHPDAKNVLFEMVFNQARPLYIPFLVLSIMATVIASQAMISGMFSIVYQGIATRVMPMFRIDYTSRERQSQIYIGFVNWFLLIAVLFIMFEFQRSSNLAAAYGLAVTGTMTLTGFMMTWIFLRRGKYWHAAVSVFVTVVNIAFLVSNTYKIPHGGFWSLIIAAIPLSMIMLYTRGQKKLYNALQPLPMDVFLLSYNQIYRAVNKISGTALFFAKDAKEVPPYIVHTMFKNNILYEDNIIVSIIRRDDPFGVTGFFKEDIAPGLRSFEIQMGYIEIPDVEEILREADIREKTIFYGVEDITATNICWQAFSVIKKLTPNIVQFFKLPANKLHGVVTRVEM